MKAYLAGPMRGYPEYNRTAFYLAAGALRRVGFEVVSPVELDEAEGVDFSQDDLTFTDEQVEDMLHRDLAELRTCRVMFLLPGWERSKGTRREREEAMKYGIPMFEGANRAAVL